MLAGEALETPRRAWKELKPMEKVVLFKLMEPKPAMRFYDALPPDEKYFLFTAFDPGSIAPITEDLSPRLRSLFHRLTEECYEHMLRGLA